MSPNSMNVAYIHHMTETLHLSRFESVDLNDSFFDSLRAQYSEFPVWFAKKAREPVYIINNSSGPGIQGFVYLKVENGPIVDVDPPLPSMKRLKVGTLKIVSHGTKLGERVLKKIFDHALHEKVEEIYVTLFDTHAGLINLFSRYGFAKSGVKATPNGVEMVLTRSMRISTGDIRKDYPFIHAKDRKIWLLAIYPDYHSTLLPDSILKTEKEDIIKDVSHTNTIHKVYIAKLALTRIGRGDIIIIYRTTDIPGRARFRSVATSVCVAEEVKTRSDFANVDAFLKFAQPHSVFSAKELREWYGSRDRLYVLKMMYNLALPKRPNRDALLEVVGISEQPRWDLRLLTHAQFVKILDLGQVDESLVVD